MDRTGKTICSLVLSAIAALSFTGCNLAPLDKTYKDIGPGHAKVRVKAYRTVFGDIARRENTNMGKYDDYEIIIKVDGKKYVLRDYDGMLPIDSGIDKSTGKELSKEKSEELFNDYAMPTGNF